MNECHDSKVFLGGIEPNDIRQGMLSDCWFLCALSAIAEFPHLVKNLFLEESQTVSPHGVYKLRLCKNGQWQTVTVDDYFPCWPGGGPAYSRSHGNELWVLLLEKAYAKLHGSYAAIKMGWAYEAMCVGVGDLLCLLLDGIGWLVLLISLIVAYGLIHRLID